MRIPHLVGEHTGTRRSLSPEHRRETGGSGLDPALQRYYKVGFALAVAVGAVEDAEEIRRMGRTLAGAAA
jgi:hypothetical protein